MDLKRLHCPSCGSEIPSEEVHLDLSLARCTACRAVFDLAGRKGAELQERQPKKPARAPVPLPHPFQADERRHSGLTVKWRWLRPHAYFLALWCLVWDTAILGFLVGGALKAAPFLLLHIAAGAAITYWTL